MSAKFSMCLVLLLTLTRLAWAEDADKLFTEASTLAAQGKYAEACPKFEESQRLDPALGTQFNLALCYEHIGRLGSAWRNYQEVARLARATGKKAREDASREKMAALRPRVAHLVLRTVQTDVEIKVDGELIDREAASFYAVDPGEHVVDATASARKPWQTRIMMPEAEGTEIAVEVPALAVAAGKTITVEKEKTNVRRVLGFVVGGVGVVGIAAAITTGVVVLDAKATADKECNIGPMLTCADQKGRDAVALGKTLLPINAIAWGVGIAALGGGAILVLTAGSTKKATTASLTPLVGANGGGLILSGRF
jgi:hypothetical protein